ncbi:hypothetical protein ARMGADRAFT_677273 [Armillaria gallica]|uniref:Uncharacterized protein n=1 Tax=Armillaria gallica TaxID=47427 RepID=A0A2H3CN31_ARMGA|nr:hypothetical protein ARMGADRAFT_677273 [Armillaria gallica]
MAVQALNGRVTLERSLFRTSNPHCEMGSGTTKTTKAEAYAGLWSYLMRYAYPNSK